MVQLSWGRQKAVEKVKLDGPFSCKRSQIASPNKIESHIFISALREVEGVNARKILQNGNTALEHYRFLFNKNC